MKPSLPKGTRDFSPIEMGRRNFILQKIRAVFEKYGYQQIETPSMENLSTLEGKYGEEGDKLLFRVLNSGPVVDQINASENPVKQSEITEKGLRYDLTVPFARYVVMHQNDITFPFKRYQIQPVWRADRPQKGRYREFYQCDADVIGSQSLVNEAELMLMIDEVFSSLYIEVVIKINNRKILAGIAEAIKEPKKIIDITVAMDKLDKIGIDGVNKELLEKGVSAEAVKKLEPILTFKGTYQEKLSFLKSFLQGIEIGLNGIKEVEDVQHFVDASHRLKCDVELDLSLARGLNYYTGAIFEVKAKNVSIGSISGGGRYDDLTGIFGLPNVSGVGISFGIDRIYDTMDELNLFSDRTDIMNGTRVLFAHFGEKERNYCLPLASRLREHGVPTEVYPDITKKIAKQLEYGNKKRIPFIVVVGEEEMNSGKLALKNMTTGEQTLLNFDEILNYLSN